MPVWPVPDGIDLSPHRFGVDGGQSFHDRRGEMNLRSIARSLLGIRVLAMILCEMSVLERTYMSFHYAPSAFQADLAQAEPEAVRLHLALIQEIRAEEIWPVARPLPLSRVVTLAALGVMAWLPFVGLYLAQR
jgi:hypothetical protein